MPRLQITAKQLFVLCLVISASVVIVLRSLEPVQINYDMGIQLNSAMYFQNEGRLLSDFFAKPSPDLAKELTPVTLTWFPPLFSVLVGLGLKSGLALGAVIHLLDGATVLFGWLGWGLLFCRACPSPLKLSHSSIAAVCAILMLVPLVYTPWYGGTDSFLWCATPWFIILLLVGWSAPQRSAANFILAGFLAAGAVGLRYASAFLAITGLIHFVLAWRTMGWAALRGLVYVAVSGALGVLPLFVFMRAATGHAAPGHQYVSLGFEWVCKRLREVLSGAPTAVSSLGIPQLDNLNPFAPSWNTSMIAGALVLSVIILVFALATFLALRRNSASATACAALAAIPFANVGFLACASFTIQYLCISDGRYYFPVIPALPLLVLAILCRHNSRRAAVATCLLASAFISYVGIFRQPGPGGFPFNNRLAKNDIEIFSLAQCSKSWPKRTFRLSAFAESSPIQRASAMHAEMEKIRRSNPNALFYVQFPCYVQYAESRSPYRGIPEQNFWNTAVASRDLSIYLASLDSGTNRILSTASRTEVTVPGSTPKTLIWSDRIWSIHRVELARTATSHADAKTTSIDGR